MERAKAIGLVKLKLYKILNPFSQYGLQDNIPPVVREIVEAAEELHRNLSQPSHKGEICHIDNKTLCQEGSCSECAIFIRGTKPWK